MINDAKLDRRESFLDVLNKFRPHLENSHPCMKWHNVFDRYPLSTKDLCHHPWNPAVGTPLHFAETTILLMDRFELLSNTKNKEIFEYLLGRHVQDKFHTVQYVNADAKVKNVKCAISKLAFGYVLMTADETGTLFFTMH